MSKRHIDENGYMVVADNPVASVGVFPYLAGEIGLTDRDPNEVVYVYRPEEEIVAAADSLKLVPFVDEHEWLGEGGTAPEDKGVYGVVGEQVRFAHPHLLANLKIYANKAQDKIQRGKIELSPGYLAKYRYEPGEYNGMPYDYVQHDIRYNHLALVHDGRGGPDVAIQDHAIITIDTMELVKMNKEELLEWLEKLSDEEKTLLKEVLGVTADEKPDDEKNEDDDDGAEASLEEAIEELVDAAEAAGEAAESGEAADVDKAEEAIEAAEEAIEEAKEELEAVTADRLSRRLRGVRRSIRVTDTVEALKRKVKRLDEKARKATMDTAEIMDAIAARDELAAQVAQHVGTFDHKRMTLQQVAEYGIKKMGLTGIKTGDELAALKAAIQVKTIDRQLLGVPGQAAASDTKSKIWGGEK